MTTSTLELSDSRRDHVAADMLADLEGRFAGVEVLRGPRGWSCIVAGPTWESRFRGGTRYEAIDAAHSTYYWPIEAAR